MTDKEFILFLIALLWNEVSDGDTPEESDFETISQELTARGIDPDEVMSY